MMFRTRETLALVTVGLLSTIGCKENASPEVQDTKAAVTAKAEVAPTAGPSDLVYAASNVIRVVDMARGEVVGQVDLKKAIRQIRFADNGRAYVAASNGLHLVDANAHRLVRQITEQPVRNVDIADDGKSLDLLWHTVTVKEDKTREINPFQLSTIELEGHTETAKREVGQRIYFAAQKAGANAIVVGEKGTIRTVNGSASLNDEGTEIDPHAGLSTPDKPLRVRHETARHGDKVYLSVEGYPSRVLEVNLTTGASQAFPLDRAYPLRGIGVTPDGKNVLVNVGVGVVVYDLEKKEIAHRIETPAPTQGIAVSSDGRYVYTAQVVDEKGGAVHALSIADGKHVKKVHLDDISPWAIAVRPR